MNTLEKVGAERRLVTAGEHKGFLDPFSAIKPEEQTYLQSMLSEIHKQFIDRVLKGRGDRIKKDPSLFTGLVWTGIKAKEMD